MECVNVISTNVTSVNLSRHELLEWVKGKLNINLIKVEELCTGAAYCKLVHMLFPSFVPLKRVKLNATQEYEYIQNLKILQSSLLKIGCKQVVPIDKLIKRRFQDNLEFLQWFKKFYDANDQISYPASDNIAENFNSMFDTLKLNTTATLSTPSVSKPAQSASKNQGSNNIADLNNQICETEEERERTITQRDFYYTKLRRIEELCKESPRSPQQSGEDTNSEIAMVKAKLLEILYRSEDTSSHSDAEEY